jgi:hypothetical protein
LPISEKDTYQIIVNFRLIWIWAKIHPLEKKGELREKWGAGNISINPKCESHIKPKTVGV